MANESSKRETSQTLLERLRANEPEAWDFMVRLYTPLLRHWIGRAGVQGPDAEDVCQEVLRVAATRVRDYNRERPGASFRGWLRGITQNMLLKLFERRGRSPQASGGTDALRRLEQHVGSADDAGEETEAEVEKNTLYRRAMELVRARFEAKTWEAFHLTVLDGRSPNDVAVTLGISPASVRKYKCRVLNCLRGEIGELID